MQGEQIHLLRRLDRHEMHGRSLHRFRDCLDVAVVVFVSLEQWLDVLRWDQTHIVTERRKLSCDKMRAGKGFHPAVPRSGPRVAQGRWQLALLYSVASCHL